MRLKNFSVLALSLLLVLSSGCATRKLSLAQCAGLGAAAGAGAGGGAASSADTNDWIGVGVAIGAVVGAASGWLICKAIPEEVAAVPVPEPQAVTPPPAPPPTPARVVLRGVNFGFDSAVPVAGSQAVLDVAAETLLANPEVHVRVEGHTDSVGPAEYNRDLSRRRAEAVRDMLVVAGVASERLEVVPLGEDRPLANNETSEGRRINRRVQLVTVE